MKRIFVVAVTVGMLLLLSECSSSGPTTSDQYAALEQELAQANKDVAQAEAPSPEAADERDSS